MRSFADDIISLTNPWNSVTRSRSSAVTAVSASFPSSAPASPPGFIADAADVTETCARSQPSTPTMAFPGSVTARPVTRAKSSGTASDRAAAGSDSASRAEASLARTCEEWQG